MGAKIAQYFEEAGRLGGIVAKMRLAAATAVTSAEAATTEDTRELVQRFEDAMVTLRATFRGAAATRPAREGAIAPSGTTQRDTQRLRNHMQIFLDLMSQRALVLGDSATTIQRVNEAACSALECARVSVWSLEVGADGGSLIRCADLFEAATTSHATGTELFARDFPAYFDALRTERTIAAHDAHDDPRTSCFSAPYLGPLGITSMLDVPIWVGGTMWGVVCHEHIGPKRSWTSDEETFAYLMANFVSLALERQRTEAAGVITGPIAVGTGFDAIDVASSEIGAANSAPHSD